MLYLCKHFKRERMKRIYGIIVALCWVGAVAAQEAKADYMIWDDSNKKKVEDYHFSVTYRLNIGYAQDRQHSRDLSYPNTYFYGGNVGVTFDFNLPLHFSIQTGVMYSLLGGHNDQHFRSMSEEFPKPEYLEHRLTEHTLSVPVYATFTQKVWKDLALFFYTGPNFSIGLAQKDKITPHMTDEVLQWVETKISQPTQTYEKYGANDLHRFNIQWGLGGGVEWQKYRLQAGYNFGLNNMVKQCVVPATARKWGWYVMFSYAL